MSVAVAVVFPAMTVTAVIFMMVFMTITVGLGAEPEFSLCKCFGSLIRRSAYSSTEFYSGFRKGHLCAHSNSAADKNICLDGFKETCKGSVS